MNNSKGKRECKYQGGTRGILEKTSRYKIATFRSESWHYTQRLRITHRTEHTYLHYMTLDIIRSWLYATLWLYVFSRLNNLLAM